MISKVIPDYAKDFKEFIFIIDINKKCENLLKKKDEENVFNSPQSKKLIIYFNKFLIFQELDHFKDISNYQFLEDEGFEFEVGCREKERKKIMREAMKKLKESNDEKKIELAEKLARHYEIYDLIEKLPTKPHFPFEEDKYGSHYLSSYLEGILVTAKRGIAGVIIALGNDEELDPFTKYLMFTHMYTPEQVKEIGHEEIYRRQQKFKED